VRPPEPATGHGEAELGEAAGLASLIHHDCRAASEVPWPAMTTKIALSVGSVQVYAGVLLLSRHSST
jgi:hypothetical protein